MAKKAHPLLKSNPQELPEHIFRAYDIRGIVDEDLTPAIVHDIGLAIGTEVRARKQDKVILGRDGRLSGPRLASALRAGLTRTGCEVVDVGVVPTPVLYYGAQWIGRGTGVMLTGSHNPKDYNGIKMVINGTTLCDDAIQALRQRIIDGDLTEGRRRGKERASTVTWEYVDSVDHSIHMNRRKRLRIVVDAGNGVAGDCAPGLYRDLGCNVDEIYCGIDGHFPNHHPDPSIPENLGSLIARVKKADANLGLAFDGDGDRVGVVTPAGRIINSDRVLMLFAREMLKENPGAKVLYDVKSSRNVEDFVRQHGGEPEMCPSGHALLKKRLQETGAALAGELSGHFFFNDRWYGFDDGLYAGGRMLEILSKTNKNADELFAEIPESVSTPEIAESVEEADKAALMQKLSAQAEERFPEARRIITLDGVRIEFGAGWGLVRASNTSPKLVMRFEADNEEALEQIQHSITEWVRQGKAEQ